MPPGPPASDATAYKSSKMSCSRLENSIIFWLVEKENNQTKNNQKFWLFNSFFSLFEKYHILWLPSHSKPYLKLLCESFNQRIRGKRQCRIVILISANIFGAAGTNRKALKPSRAITRDPGSWRKHFWVANANSWPCLSEYGLGKKYMCVIMKCNTVITAVA